MTFLLSKMKRLTRLTILTIIYLFIVFVCLFIYQRKETSMYPDLVGIETLYYLKIMIFLTSVILQYMISNGLSVGCIIASF